MLSPAWIHRLHSTARIRKYGHEKGGHLIEVKIEVPEGALASLNESPDSFRSALRLAAAAKWYELKRVSQGRAAEIAGLSRSEFLEALGRFKVSPFQYSADEVIEEALG